MRSSYLHLVQFNLKLSSRRAPTTNAHRLTKYTLQSILNLLQNAYLTQIKSNTITLFSRIVMFMGCFQFYYMSNKLIAPERISAHAKRSGARTHISADRGIGSSAHTAL